jgi:sugar phosphate isomerase/epimerase
MAYAGAAPKLKPWLGRLAADRRLTVAAKNAASGDSARAYGVGACRQLRLHHLTLDTTHVGTWGLDLLAVYERLKERIVHVHLSNYDGQEHRRPEQGHLPLAELLNRLAQDDYPGTVTLELGPDVLEAEDEDQVRAHLRHAVTFCRERLGLR